MHPVSPSSWRGLLAALLLAAGAPGWAQADPPGRVAYISTLEGRAEVSQASDPGQWTPATPNWPITTGSRLRLDPGTRVELDGGSLALRLLGVAELTTTALDDDTTQVALMAGSLSLRLRELDAGERVEIDTPQLALVARQPGEYRVDVDPGAGTTRVTVRAGDAVLYGESGESMPLAGGSEVLVADRGLGLLASGAAPARDAFDQWAARRDAQEARSASARYLPRAMPGYQELDAYGQWAQDATWGPVWYPSITVADWAPYRYGRWAWVEPWGWTWVDDAPWGFAPFHYGRWTQIGPRWAWVPGPVTRRPVYAPALVQFFASGSNWSVSIGSRPLGAAWFPLAPGEAWQPHYHASPRYLGRINDWSHGRGPPRRRGDAFFFQHRPGAVSLAPAGGFGRPQRTGARPHYRDGHQLPPGWLQTSRPATPPARVHGPQGPGATSPHRPARSEGRERFTGTRPPAAPQASRPAPNLLQPGWRPPALERPLPERRRAGASWHERQQSQSPLRPPEIERPAPGARRLERPRPAFEAGAADAARAPHRAIRQRTEADAPPRTPRFERAPERTRAAAPPPPWFERAQAESQRPRREQARRPAREREARFERHPEPRAQRPQRQHERTQQAQPRRERGQPSERWRERMRSAP